MKIASFLLAAALAFPALAEEHNIYKATLGPVESVKVTFEPDRRIKIEHELKLGEYRVDVAVGDYHWNGNHLEITIDEVRSNWPDQTAFTLEIRRKGVEGVPPQIEVKAGRTLDFTTERDHGNLTMTGPDGWQLALFKTH